MRSIVLRPVMNGDQGFCYRLAASSFPQWLRVCGRGLPSPAEFEDLLWVGVHAQFIVEDAQAHLPVGVGSLHRPSERHGTVWIDLAVEPSLGTHDDVVSPASSALLHHAFDACGFRKAYCGRGSWAASILDPTAWEVRREAVLEGHLLHEGIYWDYVVESVMRSSA